MYFKLYSPQKDKYTDMGMVNIDASFYLEEGDEGYDGYMAEYHVQVPVIPEGGYPGKVDEMGKPVDKKDYDTWYASLKRVWQLNAFCNHSIQFEPDATEEEILAAFERALTITHQNYLKNDLHCKRDGQVVNADIGYPQRKAEYQTLDTAKTLKIQSAEVKVSALKDVDFTQVETVGSYKVR